MDTNLNNVTIQWFGHTPSKSGKQTIGFPISFNSTYYAVAKVYDEYTTETNGVGRCILSLNRLSASQIEGYSNSTSVSHRYIAIGY